MNKWWNWLVVFSLICMLFLAIPLSSNNNRTTQQMKKMFDKYIENFNKTYKQNLEEYETRFQHFMVSLEEIDRLNSETKGLDNYKARYGLTKLSDMSTSEYKEIHLSDERLHKSPSLYGKSWKRNSDSDKYVVDDQNYLRDVNNDNHYVHIVTRSKRAVLPEKVDWRTKGVVGPVRDQGLCGACWAFSTVATMEAMQTMSTGKLQPLSVQEVIDCAGLGNQGCSGGDICLLLDWLLLTRTPVELDKQYPLQLTNGACRVTKNNTGVRVASFTCDNFVGSEQKIIEALATHGPVAVAINALTWQNYLGGVVQYHCSGAVPDLNHAVQLVGYDLTAPVPYYIAKNSWGPGFGLDGYIHLAVGGNICGLANEVATIDVV